MKYQQASSYQPMPTAWAFLCLFNLHKEDINMIKGLAITPPILGRISIGKMVEKNGKEINDTIVNS